MDPIAAAALASINGGQTNTRMVPSRSAALSAAAQRLAKPKAPGGQQIQGRDVTTQGGQTGITGRGGNFQPLGQAAQAKLRGFGGAPGPTPPTMDPAQKPPAWQALQQAGIGGQGSAAANRAAAAGLGSPPGGPNVFHPTNPGAVEPSGPDQMQGGPPTVPFGGKPPVFGTPGQQLGTPGAMDPGTAEGIHQMGGTPPTGAGGLPQMDGSPGGVPLGAMPGPAQKKPLLRGFGGQISAQPGQMADLPTKPMAAPPPGGGSIWNRIAGGGGMPRRNMASY